ncbi:MAG: signal peptidase II [Spirochaetes bacterium]|nr:signal peptidase II [Spirochaetota bacterium]
MIRRDALRILFMVLVVAVNIGCDQSTKFFAKKYLQGRGTVRVVDDFFILRYAENNGAFMSIFSPLPRGARIALLTVLPGLAMAWLSWRLLRRRDMAALPLFALCCILGGGISNIADRVTNNEFVVDFMNVGIGSLRSGILNFADLSIVLGVGIIAWLSLRGGNGMEWLR